jgi:hypothetical protein
MVEICPFCDQRFEPGLSVPKHVWAEHMLPVKSIPGCKRCWCKQLCSATEFFKHVELRGGCLAHYLSHCLS